MIVGLTGGIATGKSTVSHALERTGLRVIDADLLAREVVAPGTQGLRDVIDVFGEEYLTESGALDRAKLGDTIFSNREWREKLNSIIHPLVRAEMWRQANEYVGDDPSRIAILDVPLLIEGGTHTVVDVTVLVYTPFAIQLARLIERNGLTEQAARARIEAQWPIEEKRGYAQIVIDNSGPFADVPRLVDETVRILRDWATHGVSGGQRVIVGGTEG